MEIPNCEVNPLFIFLSLFTLVYFLEAIGGSYMVAAVQNIERQFQIPSRLSGFIVSSHDITYILTVIFISYYGSKGNRAKWIGVGTLLIAFSQLLTASSNFLFPHSTPQLSLSEFKKSLEPTSAIMLGNATIKEYFDYLPLHDRIPENVRKGVLDKLIFGNMTTDLTFLEKFPTNYTTKNPYLLDEPLVAEVFQEIRKFLQDPNRGSENLLRLLQNFVDERKGNGQPDINALKRSATISFAFCNRFINEFRSALKDIKCSEENRGMAPLLTIFVAMLIMGIGRTMPWSLGIPLIDDNVSKQRMPVYFGLFNFFKIMGPICGFVIGSVVNKLYYTFPTKAPRGLDSNDPTWIGAWWLGFLFIGIVKIIPSIAFFFYPSGKNVKKTAAITNGNGMPTLETAIKGKPKITLFDKHVKNNKTNLWDSYKEVLSSKVYISVVLARVLDILAFKGYMVFLPKYLENHFGIAQYMTTLYIAIFGVVGFAGGVITGGFITRKFKLNGRKAAIYVVIVSSLNTLLFLTKNFIGCHSVVNSVGLAGQETNFNYTRPCNAECGCESASLYPVCDSAGAVFYSPCHAGCRHFEEAGPKDFTFAECACAEGRIVSKRFCIDDCKNVQYIFFLTIIVGAFIGGTGVVPGMLLLLRSVPPKTRSPALGLNGFIISLFGTMPSPVLWGWVIDGTCLVWASACPGAKGSCQIYDPTRLRVWMHTMYAVIRTFSILVDIYVVFHAKGINIQEDEEEVEKEVGRDSIQLNIMPQ